MAPTVTDHPVPSTGTPAIAAVNETSQESMPPDEEAVAPLRSNPALVSTSRARRSASALVGRPGTVVVGGQVGGGTADVAGGVTPDVPVDAGVATAHPDETEPPPEEDSVQGRLPVRCTCRLRLPP